jgi:RNA polymerase sigma-70 factor (ECF subfamily)
MTENSQAEPDPQAARRLLSHSREQLIAIANGIVCDRHEAEDVVQETIAAVWRRLADIAPDKLTPYLKRAVRQNAAKRKSRRRHYATSEGYLESERTADDTPAWPVDPLELEEAIESLPLAQQNVVRMKYYLGMTFRQIGVSLSISTHTAASRCRYALRKLKRILKG